MRILISEDEIQQKVTSLANEIDQYLREENFQEEPVFVCVLTGSIFFFSELVRNLKNDVITEYIKVSSYQGKFSTQNIKILKDISIDITNRIVFIVEDIIDTGLTLNKIISLFRERNPQKILVCTLLDKPSKRLVEVKVDFCGFVIPPEFVVGYGLDYDEKFRNKPYIYVIEEE
ncbi:MAG: hypoxanthine phosphoribosyltransferase [Candidatus Calescibacterium sp.]|nr:hypoxanthine phosphoribosyltransferase [Candidatus Calescibacterium sp.]MCX7758933.1 hypoxanthine phosphoribosyltransferase [bacterium]